MSLHCTHTHCAGLGWLECSSKAILCQRYISFGVVLFPAVLSYMASAGWCGDGLSLFSSIVMRLERRLYKHKDLRQQNT